jgi:hypothetical protein
LPGGGGVKPDSDPTGRATEQQSGEQRAIVLDAVGEIPAGDHCEDADEGGDGDDRADLEIAHAPAFDDQRQELANGTGNYVEFEINKTRQQDAWIDKASGDAELAVDHVDGGALAGHGGLQPCSILRMELRSVLWAAGEQAQYDEADQDGRDPLLETHPFPASQSERAVEFRQAVRDRRTDGSGWRDGSTRAALTQSRSGTASDHAISHLTISPHPSNPPVSRVTTAASWQRAIAAIIRSNVAVGWPVRRTFDRKRAKGFFAEPERVLSRFSLGQEEPAAPP